MRLIDGYKRTAGTTTLVTPREPRATGPFDDAN